MDLWKEVRAAVVGGHAVQHSSRRTEHCHASRTPGHLGAIGRSVGPTVPGGVVTAWLWLGGGGRRLVASVRHFADRRGHRSVVVRRGAIGHDGRRSHSKQEQGQHSEGGDGVPGGHGGNVGAPIPVRNESSVSEDSWFRVAGLLPSTHPLDRRIAPHIGPKLRHSERSGYH